VARIREEMARLYKQTRRGAVSPADASRLAFVLMNLAKLIEGSDFEKRLELLEAATRRPNHGGTPHEVSP